MAEVQSPNVNDNAPKLQRPIDKLEAATSEAFQVTDPDLLNRHGRRQTIFRQRRAKHAHITESTTEPSAATHDIYLGSYAHSCPRKSSHRPSLVKSPAATPRTSASHLQLVRLLPTLDTDMETYGVDELRDGFFDASFNRPLSRDHDQLKEKALLTLPDVYKRTHHPLSLRRFLPQQFLESASFFRKVTTTRAGIKLFKSFLGFFIAYVICLIPACRDWLGQYNYIMVISALINHPGRAVGSQIDGTLMTILGTIAGLGWGALGLFVSTSTSTAQSGYGGLLAAFLIFFTALIGWLRCVFLRFYQAVLSAGISICYVCLADTSQSVGWMKVFDYGIPWLFGQAICLIVSILVFPEIGSRSLA